MKDFGVKLKAVNDAVAKAKKAKEDATNKTTGSFANGKESEFKAAEKGTKGGAEKKQKISIEKADADAEQDGNIERKEKEGQQKKEQAQLRVDRAVEKTKSDLEVAKLAKKKGDLDATREEKSGKERAKKRGMEAEAKVDIQRYDFRICSTFTHALAFL